MNEKLESMEFAGCAPVDEATARRVDEMKKNEEEEMKRRPDKLERDMREASAAAAAARPGASSTGPWINGDLVVIGGSPRRRLESPQHLREFVQDHGRAPLRRRSVDLGRASFWPPHAGSDRLHHVRRFVMPAHARAAPPQDFGFPSDHKAVIAKLKFHEPRIWHTRRYTRKPAGWRPNGDVEDYRELIRDMFTPPRELTITEFASNLHLAAMQMGIARPPPCRVGRSATEDRLSAVLASATAFEEEWRSPADELWFSRHEIEIEKRGTASAEVLEHQRFGGRGSRHLSARPGAMAFLADPAGGIVGPDEVKSRAHWYYAELLNKSSRNKPNLPDSWNKRIMNSSGLDPERMFADRLWNHFGISVLPKMSAPTEPKLLRHIAILLASANLWSLCFPLILGEWSAIWGGSVPCRLPRRALVCRPKTRRHGGVSDNIFSAETLAGIDVRPHQRAASCSAAQGKYL